MQCHFLPHRHKGFVEKEKSKLPKRKSHKFFAFAKNLCETHWRKEFNLLFYVPMWFDYLVLFHQQRTIAVA